MAVKKGLVASVYSKKVGSAWWLSWALDPWFRIRSRSQGPGMKPLGKARLGLEAA